MKFIVVLLLIVNTSFAGMKTFTYSTNKVISNSLENILAIVTDSESYCKSCKYKIKEIVSTQIVEYQNDTFFYTWIHSTSIAGTYKYFSYIDYTFLDDDIVTIKMSYPSSQESARLSHAYGKEHKIPFNVMEVTWTVKRLDNNQAHVSFQGLYKTDNPLAGLLKKTIQKGIEKGVNLHFDQFFMMESPLTVI